ncbi:MAG: type IV pilus modification protein PilV [Pseudomonadota bacterium]
MSHTPPSPQSGFSLIEVMIAMAIFAFGLLALAALQVAALRATTDSQYITQANLLANEMVGMMWGTPTATALSAYHKLDTQANLPSSPSIVAANASAWREDILRQLPQGRGQIAVNGTQVTVTVSWQSRTGQRSHALTTQIGN